MMIPARATKVRYLVLVALCAAAMIAYVHRSCISVPAKLIQEDLQLSTADMSRIMSAFYLGYALFQLPGGWLGDRWGTRAALSLLALVWSAATGLMGLASTFGVLYALWLTNGLAQAGIFPCSVKSISQWFPASERGLPSGMLGSFMSIGAALASSLIGVLVEYVDWQVLFVMLSLPGILFAAVFYAWFRNQPAEHSWVSREEIDYIQGAENASANSGSSRVRWIDLLTCVPLYLICLQQFFRAACYIFYTTWAPTFLQKGLGASLAGSGILTSLPLAGVITGSATSGLTIDWIWRRTGSRRLSRQGVGVASTLGAGLFLVLAQFLTELAPAVACITASAVCAGFSGPAGYTVTIDLAGKRVATLFSIMNMSGNLGAVVCPLVVGGLMEQQNWPGVLLFLAGFYFAACVCWSFLNVRRDIGEKNDAPYDNSSL
jgi:MFS transporter, ACS family, D-galactonate transporter